MRTRSDFCAAARYAANLGDEKAMVKVGPMKTPAHDRCAFEQLGVGVVNLPKEERAKFTFAVVGDNGIGLDILVSWCTRTLSSLQSPANANRHCKILDRAFQARR